MRGQKKHSGGFNHSNPIRPSRLIAIGAVFLVVALIYLVQLITVRVFGSNSGLFSIYDGGISKTTVSVSAVRGDIYDRNGVLLVTDRTLRDLSFTYEAIPDTSKEFNVTIAQTVEAMKRTETVGTRTEFPIDGTYPSYRYFAEAVDPESPYYMGMQTVLSSLGLPKDAACDTLIDAIVQKYSLKKSGLTDAEIDTVIRVRYDMIRKGFGVYTPYVLAEDVSDRLITYIEELDIRGAVFTARSERVYLYPGYASHILGEVGKIPESQLEYYTSLGYPMDAVVGISGCEAAYEEYLHGIDGALTKEYDENGRLLNYYYETIPTAGQDVYLTIDIEVQIRAEDALRENIQSIASSGGATSGADADAGAVVAIDPDDFSIVAIASYPTYDLSTYGVSYGDLVLDETKPLLNRALNGIYEPGSTFKIGVALAALEESVITPATTINDTGIYTYYPGYHPRCWIYTDTGHGHGAITVTKAIEVSCNYFFYEVGRLLGIDRITQYMHSLGLGCHTGIELPAETGILASPAYRDENGETPWTSGDTLQAAIGQSNNLFSPLQMACYFATVFNGGTRYSAHLLSSVKAFYTGETVTEYTGSVESTIDFSDETYDTLLKGITDVVTASGTLSRHFKDLKAAGVTIGGKTGTAQVSSGSSDNALFAAYAEQNGKKLVSVCVIEHGASGANAAYTVSELMEAYFLTEKES